MTVNHFSVVPKIIKNSDLIALVPTHTVAQSIFDGELAVREAPITTQPNPLTAIGIDAKIRPRWNLVKKLREHNHKGGCQSSL